MKFNLSNKGINIVTNYEGEKAYRLTPEWQLYTATVTSSLNNTFYESIENRIGNIRTLITQCDPLFVARLAVYTRQEMNMRSIPLVLAVELAKVHHGDNTVRKMVSQIIQRADEITELLAYYQIANKRKGTKKLNCLSKQIQAGLQQAFNSFDEYQFAKYNRDTEVKLRDALFLVHPKAKNKIQQLLFNKITDNSLETPYTWETELSALGQTIFESEKEKQEAITGKWEELIESGKMGYMALLRNLRNILEANVSENQIQKICTILSAKRNVERSRQLPFRFLAAYREISNMPSVYTGQIINTLEEAITVSAGNIPGFDNDTNILIACDVSRSMQTPISPRSKILLYDVGLMLAMLLQSRCKQATTGLFGDKWKIVTLSSKAILANVQAMYKREGEVGYATNGHLVIKDLLEKQLVIDKVMIFTDLQLWNNSSNNRIVQLWEAYKEIAPDSKLYLFDLAGHGTTPLNIERKDVYLISGWSDKIFHMLAAIENGGNVLDEIKKIEL